MNITTLSDTVDLNYLKNYYCFLSFVFFSPSFSIPYRLYSRTIQFILQFLFSLLCTYLFSLGRVFVFIVRCAHRSTRSTCAVCAVCDICCVPNQSTTVMFGFLKRRYSGMLEEIDSFRHAITYSRCRPTCTPFETYTFSCAPFSVSIFNGFFFKIIFF